MRIAVVGGAGYIGGELLRLLLCHPDVELVQATSDRQRGQPLHAVHPNLRHLTSLRFTAHDELGEADAVFLALPHGTAMHRIDELARRDWRIVDLSADFRLRDPRAFARHHGVEHRRPDLVERFVPGLPELGRERLRGARWISVPGCQATAAILALRPLAAAGLVAGDVLIDARTGSSGSGSSPAPAAHHAERSGVMRVYQPTGHRHEAEVAQACGVSTRMTVTAVEAVRGVQVVLHLRPSRPLRQTDLWEVYRAAYADEPFVRLVSQRSGLYRHPEPKVLSGTNLCDVGFAVDEDGCRVVLIGALDNLGKGGAGNAVQCLNVAAGLDERAGLGFPGLHPI
jgi:N-acetyl-gamma-glutamyl-phosphate/LysW-gamma-L-alpha-aminoadipyl-6-phosphate reductase